MATIEDSGTLLAATHAGSSTSIFSSTNARVFVATIDLSLLQAGDTLKITVKAKVLTGGSKIIMYEDSFSDVQVDPDAIRVSIPFPSAYDYEVFLHQTAGTDRNFDWNVVSVGGVSVVATGTQTAVISTEHDLASPTDNKTYAMITDMSNMVASDVVELRVKASVASGGAENEVFLITLTDEQSDPDIGRISAPIASPFSATFSLKQTAGTGRDFDYVVVSSAN